VQGLEPLLTSPATSGLFLDFDGTLSEIAPVPQDARPLPGVPELLGRLAGYLGIVAIVSGRAAAELVEWLGPDVEIWGVHGTQIARGGTVSLSQLAEPYGELIARVKEEARADFEAHALPGMVFEDKGVMFSFHFRAAEDPVAAEAVLDKLSDEIASTHGLWRARTRYSFELRPPSDFSKAAVLLERARESGLTAAAFVGDDRVDLPAFDALDQLADDGMQTTRVAVRWTETPPELLERADVIVDGPAGAVGLLESLASALGA
jgi:trehalose 6-phosphate phosphatase